MSRPNLLRELIKLNEVNESYRSSLATYSRMLEQGEFKFFRDMLLTLKGNILSEMLSSNFTELEAIEKDIMQRTYYNLNSWLDFLIAPTRYIQAKKAKLQNHAERLRNAKREQAVANGERKEG